MIVDASALIAVIMKEPAWDQILELMAASASLAVSAATMLETAIVVDGKRSPELSRKFDDFIRDSKIRIEPVTADQVKVAREAYRDYGRGSGHPAKLNFGDCFSYALARVTGEPLLYKGDDFAHTDLKPALPGA